MWPSLLCQPQIVACMCLLSCLQFPTGSEHLQPILANRLQHAKSWFLSVLLCLLHQALVDERSDPLQYLPWLVTQSSIERIYCLQSSSTHKNGQPPDEVLLLHI